MKHEATISSAKSSPKSSSKAKPKVSIKLAEPKALNIKLSDPNTAAAVGTASLASNNTPSPKKSIDILANKLLARKQEEQPDDKPLETVTEKQSTDLVNIFGPEMPLQGKVETGDDDASRDVARNEPEGPSELELLAEELTKELAKEKQQKQAEEALKKDPSSIPADKLEEDKQSLIEEVQDEKASHKMHQLKYKIKAPVQEGGASSINPSTPAAAKHQAGSTSLTQTAAAADSNPLRRMRKKELLNQYYGIEVQVQPPTSALTNGPSSVAPPVVTQVNTSTSSEPAQPPVRNIIKMPKAVASVTSVPTRADYQSQLEANMERKRRREGKDPIDSRGKDGKKGKGKKGKQPAEEEPYIPKSKIVPEEFNTNGDTENKNDNRRTRGKPPKKCLEPGEDLEDLIGDNKSQSLKFAKEMLKKFEQEDSKPNPNRKEERRKEKRKRKRDAEVEDEPVPSNAKTPRIVIKFSKNKSDPQPPKNITKENNGLTKPPVILTKAREADETNPIPKLKLKVGSGGKV